MTELWTRFTTHDSLLAIGMTLLMLGLVLRGLATSSRRAAALKRQHWLHHRPPGEIDPTPNEATWWDRRLPRLANFVTGAGILLTLAGFWRS